jgi:2-iminobutanoate/2-iminopropanoate deaminase
MSNDCEAPRDECVFRHALVARFVPRPLSVKMRTLFSSLSDKDIMAAKTIVQTEGAPQAIGPYSQAIKIHGLLFASGQIPIDPATGEFVAGGISEQTEQVIKNLSAVLAAGGSALDRVVKTTVYLADMNEFAAMNAVYGKFFAAEPPARATVEAARLPRDARVEIEAIATVD